MQINGPPLTSTIGGLPAKFSVHLATAAALPACTYANGTSGIGATLTANSTGALTVDGVAAVLDRRYLIKDQVTTANNGIYTLTRAGVTGVAQVETLTVAVTSVTAGNAEVIITAAALGGSSPLVVPVAVANADSAATVAGKVRTALGAISAITDVFTVGGAGADVALTALTATSNDATLNIEIDNDTSGGITAVPTSTNTTAGVAGVAFILTRATDADEWTDLPGAMVEVELGSTNADKVFVCTSNAGGTMGSTAITFDLPAGLLKTANNLSDVASAATAFSNIKQAATDTATGVVELATDAETVTGTDAVRAVTPSALSARLGNPGPIGAVPGTGSFTALSATGTLTLGTTTSQITGASGNMTITAGTGNSRTLALQTTTSGGVATTALTLNADQSATFAGIGLFPDGSAPLPSVASASDPDNGMWFPGSNTVAFSVAGVNRIRYVASGLNLASGIELGWSSGSSNPTTQDTTVRRLAAQSLALARADSATPLTNTLTIGESSRAGTDTNVGGANGTIVSGTGTGTGTASSLIFQTPTTTGSGSGAQSLAERLKLNATAGTFSVPVILKGYTVATLPAGTVGMTAYVTDATTPTYLGVITGGGAVVCPVFYNGTAWVSH